MQKFIKIIILAAALALPALFISSAYAIPSCGTSCTSATKNPHGYTAATPTNCYTCHANGSTSDFTSGRLTSGTLTVKTTKESCGACAVGTAPMSISTHKNVSATTLCSVCHIRPSADGDTGGSTGGMVGIYPTRHGCGTCVIGNAPGSVSAHKNVNTNKIICSTCHMTNSTGDTSGQIDNDHGTTSSNTGNHYGDDHQPTSPGNSDFGHSHKHDKKSHDNRRDHDD